MTIRATNYLFALVFVLFLTSCDDGDFRKPDAVFYNPNSNSVFVLNQGQFQVGNGSIQVYNEITDELSDDLYQTINSGQVLGDIVQSFTVRDNKGYIMVNNSGKVVVVNMDSFELLDEITGLGNPRYLVDLKDGRGYLSNFDVSQGLSIIDFSTDTKAGTLALPSWSDVMLEVDGLVYVALPDTNILLIIDPAMDAIVGQIPVALGANSIKEDPRGRLWVLCDGGFNEELPALFLIGPDSMKIIERFDFDELSDNPNNLVINENTERMYYLNGDVFFIDPFFTFQKPLEINTNSVIQSNGRTFYGFGLSQDTQKLFIGDAVDFVQKGRVYVYDSGNFRVLNDFESGIVPGGFTFL